MDRDTTARALPALLVLAGVAVASGEPPPSDEAPYDSAVGEPVPLQDDSPPAETDATTRNDAPEAGPALRHVAKRAAAAIVSPDAPVDADVPAAGPAAAQAPAAVTSPVDASAAAPAVEPPSPPAPVAPAEPSPPAALRGRPLPTADVVGHLATRANLQRGTELYNSTGHWAYVRSGGLTGWIRVGELETLPSGSFEPLVAPANAP